MPGYEIYSLPADSKQVKLLAQLAANKIQSIQKYLIWMLPEGDSSYKDSADILHKAFAEAMQESLEQDLVTAFDYASKWEQLYYLERERKNSIP